MKATHRIARAVRSAVENRAVLAVEDARAASAIGRVPSSGEATHHVLIAPPGAGNIGDQAMVEAFVEAVDGPVVTVVRRSGDVRPMPTHLQSRVTELVLPGLLYGLPHDHVRDVIRLAPVLARARSLSVVGADIMDGAYWESPSVRRFRVARLAAARGIDSRVLGFSWNAKPSRAARRAMVSASQVVELLARDPASESRLRADGGRRIVPVADIALLTRPRPLPDDIDEWCSAREGEGRRIVLLNANGLIEHETRMIDTFLKLLDASASANCAFLAVPHVSRGTPTDVELALELQRRVGDRARLAAVDRLLSPGEIASLAQRSDLAVTGRMHLTVLSTSVGTPVVTVGYQGKVAGLYELIGTDTMIDGGEPARGGLLALIERAIAELPELAAAVEAARPALLDLARRNVARIEATHV